MTEPSPPRERTIPTPIVLAIASAMIAIGAVAYVWKRGPATPPRPAHETPEPPPSARRDDTSEIGVSETYLDAWRKRDHETALAVSVGAAHDEALARKKAEERISAPDRAATDRIWNQMSSDRLRFHVENRRSLDATHAYLEGRAVGTFLSRPYVRRVAFEVVADGDRFRVARMDLGSELEPVPADAGTHEAPADAGAGTETP